MNVSLYEGYAHAKQDWATFGCQNLGDYHDMYVATDTLLLADVFKNLRKVCQEKYRGLGNWAQSTKHIC